MASYQHQLALEAQTHANTKQEVQRLKQDLKAAVQSSKEQKNSHAEMLASHQLHGKSLAAKLEAAEKIREGLQDQLQEKSDECRTLGGELRDMESQLQRSEAGNTKKNATIENLTKELKQLKASTNSECHDLRNQIQGLQSELASLQDSRVDVNEVMAQQEKHELALHAIQQNFEKEKKRLLSQLHESQQAAEGRVFACFVSILDVVFKWP